MRNGSTYGLGKLIYLRCALCFWCARCESGSEGDHCLGAGSETYHWEEGDMNYQRSRLCGKIIRGGGKLGTWAKSEDRQKSCLPLRDRSTSSRMAYWQFLLVRARRIREFVSRCYLRSDTLCYANNRGSLESGKLRIWNSFAK